MGARVKPAHDERVRISSVAKPQHIHHRIETGRLLPAPGGGFQRAAANSVRRSPCAQFDPLRRKRTSRVLADHVAPAQRRKADMAGRPRPRMAVAHALRGFSSSMPRPSAAARPSSSAVPEGASIFWLWCISRISISNSRRAPPRLCQRRQQLTPRLILPDLTITVSFAASNLRFVDPRGRSCRSRG